MSDLQNLEQEKPKDQQFNLQEMVLFFRTLGTLKIAFVSIYFTYEKRNPEKLKLTTDKEYNNGLQSFFEGKLRKEIKFNKIKITPDQYKELIKNQQILSVLRCAESLTGIFPSGLFTFVTYPLSGMAVRHEYIIIETPNIMMSVEITKKDEGVIKVNMFNFKTKREKKLVEGIIDEGRWYSRTMMEENDCKNLNLVQMDQFMNLILQIWRNFGNGSYDFTQKNCKSLAASLYYFSRPQYDGDKIVHSIFGLFDDVISNDREFKYDKQQPYFQELYKKFNPMIYEIRKNGLKNE